MAFGIKSFLKGAAFTALNEFLGRGRDGGYARPNRFEIMIIPPSGVRGSQNAANLFNPFTAITNKLSGDGTLRNVIFNCESFSIPGRNLVSSPDTNLYGPEREVVTAQSFGDIDSTFYLSSDLKEKRFFDAWTAMAAGAESNADTLLAEVAKGLGNIAADLTALKAFQGAASSTSANMAAAGARLIDTDFALETASLTKNAILNQAALAMAAQANAAQSSILSVLQ